MNKRKLTYIIVGAATLLVALTLAGSFSFIPKAFSAPLERQENADQPQFDPEDKVVLSYAAKFVCTIAQPAGVPFYGPAAPIVQQTTEILVQNPNDYPVEVSKVANLSLLEPEDVGSIETLPWIPYGLIPPGGSFTIDCKDISQHLLGQQFQVGVTYEGFVTIAIGPHLMDEKMLYPQLDVMAEYTRGSEVLKKDIHYQPWWTFWPWDEAWGTFPWVLGFPYQRLLAMDPLWGAPYSCRQQLMDNLKWDIGNSVTDPGAIEYLHWVLDVGFNDYFRGDVVLDEPFNMPPEDPEPAIIPIIGRCEVVWGGGDPFLDVSYVIVTNVAPSGAPEYPWIPGRWYDMPVVIPQNTTMDFDVMFQDWHAYLWAAHHDFVYQPVDLVPHLHYYFPYWSGWTGWWWNYNGMDSIDIGVGEGESIDVEQIMPLRLVKPWHVVEIFP